MALQGTQKVLGGTSYKRYPDPNVKGTPSQFGLYPWSVFNAALVGLDAESGRVYLDGTLVDADIIALLLTSDIPAIAKGVVYDTSTYLQNAAIAVNLLNTNFVKTASGGSTNAAVAKYGTVLQGYAGAGALVPITGFPIYFSANSPNNTGAADYVCVECIANSPNISNVVGPTFFLPIVGGSEDAPIPVILKNSDYTPAIAAADNLITDSADQLFQVVGLYAQATKG